MSATHSSKLVPEVPGYVELQRQIHHALLAQHPEWVLPSGDSPVCDSYEARLAELLSQLQPGPAREAARANAVTSRAELQYA